jgi:tRNA pseudouridine38-40 synthase
MSLPCDAAQTYHYNLDTGTHHDPLRLRFSHHVRYPVDLDAMQAAANLLVGTHDFTQFSNDSTERLRRNPVKTLLRYDVVRVGPSHVRLEVS